MISKLISYDDNFYIYIYYFFYFNFRFTTLYQGISWAKKYHDYEETLKKYHDYEETLKKCRQLPTQTGSRGSTPRAYKEEGQRAVKTALQNSHNGGVAGGGNSFGNTNATTEGHYTCLSWPRALFRL